MLNHLQKTIFPIALAQLMAPKKTAKIKAFLLFLWVLSSLSGFCQEMSPIQKYTTEAYGGDNQNWMHSLASNNFIYVANHRGLLEFNGAVWHLFPAPNHTVMRAVKVINDTIYNDLPFHPKIMF